MILCDKTKAYYDCYALSSTINFSSRLLEQLNQNGQQSKILYSNASYQHFVSCQWNSTLVNNENQKMLKISLGVEQCIIIYWCITNYHKARGLEQENSLSHCFLDQEPRYSLAESSLQGLTSVHSTFQSCLLSSGDSTGEKYPSKLTKVIGRIHVLAA